jgi:phage terminase large subunit
LQNREIFERARRMGYAKERIVADSAEPKSIDELRELGMAHIKAARKGKDSILHGIQYIQGYRIYIHPRCVNFLTEIGNYTWEVDKSGQTLNKPAGGFDHLMDAMRYALEDFVKGDGFSFE